jgi:hypothetical protein
MLPREGRLERVSFGPSDKLVQLSLNLVTEDIRGGVWGWSEFVAVGWSRAGASGVLFVSTPVVEMWQRPFSTSNLPLGFRI